MADPTHDSADDADMRPGAARAEDASDEGASDEDAASSSATAEPIDLLAPLFREEPLRPEGAEAPPMWLWMTIFGVVLFGTYYLGNYIGDFSPNPWLQAPELAVVESAGAEAEVTISGAQIYNSRCSTCHQGNGQGVAGAFPPLDGTDWVTGDKGRIVRILLHGMQGPVEVQGVTYNGAMPAWGNQLNDEEIAAVITHVRQSWSNEASDVVADEVRRVRETTEGRTEPWTAEELNANPGIPGGEAVADTTSVAANN